MSNNTPCLAESQDLVDVTGYGRVAVDAEWYSSPTKYLSKQFTFMDDLLNPCLTVILWHQDYPVPSELPVSSHPVRVIPCDVQSTVLKDVCLLPKALKVYMYYSPKDVEAMVGAQVWKDALLAKDSSIEKKRNLTGSFKHDGTTYELKDCYGAFNTGLDKAMESVGVINPYKSNVAKMLHSKDRMDLFMSQEPYSFLEYAYGDTAYLGETLAARVEQVNTIIREALGEGVVEYTIDTFITSSGSLVSNTFQAWLRATYPEMMRVVLQLTDCSDNKKWDALKTLKARAIAGGDLAELDRKASSSEYVHGLAMGSIRSYALLSQNTGLFGAMVQGGRCVNEAPHSNPYDNRLSNVVDIDLSSCYGSALKDFDYPFGIPTIYENHIDDEPKTLGAFLRRYRKELVDGLYTIVVSGMLPFEQDLIHSKYDLSTNTILKTLFSESFDPTIDTVQGREIESAHLGGTFVLTKSQIENGVITSEVLKTIEAVASNQELKAFMDLDVVCAVYYPKSKEMTVSEWTEYHGNPRSLGGKHRSGGDQRSRRWTRVPLAGFISAFIDYRKAVKAKKVSKGDQYDLLQNGVKLFINTTYGDLAAPYFPMGNTVLANNITAKARTGVWMLSKALLTVQSITDGGMFSWERVLSLKGTYKPSFDTLSDRGRLMKHRGTKVKALTDKDVWNWLKEDKSAEKALDSLCLEHINRFWSHYGLSLPFAIECKYENTARRAVYFGSSDYLLSDTVGGAKEVLKCRGAKDSEHPKQNWLRHLLEPQSVPVPQSHFVYKELIGVKEYQKANGLGAYEGFTPGDDITKETWHRPYTNGECYKTYEDYKRVQDAKKKAINRHKVLVLEDPDALFHLALKASEGVYSY